MKLKKINLKNSLLALALSALLLGSFLPARQVRAEQPGGITISPAVLYFTLTSQNPRQTKTITILNSQETDIVVALQVKRVDETSGILAPTTPITDERQAITLSTNELQIPAGKSATVDLTIASSQVLRPGGSYFSLVATQTSNATDTVGFNAAVSAVIFVTKEAGAFRKLDVMASSIPAILFGTPSQVTILFRNSGNVMVVPRGIVLITGKNNQEFLAKGVINTESLPVFPGKELRLTTPLTKLMSTVLPTKVTAVLQYRFDGTDQTTTVTKSSWLIPMQFIALVSLLLAAIVASVYYITKMRKSHKKHNAKNVPSVRKNGAKKIEIQTMYDGDKITVRKE